MVNNIYTLPEISFVGGATNDFIFHVYLDDAKTENADLDGCTANFSLVSFINKSGTPLLSKAMAIAQDEAASTLSVTLSAADTVHLSGKFVYQITVLDSRGTVIIPDQGIIHIHKNINSSAVGA